MNTLNHWCCRYYMPVALFMAMGLSSALAQPRPEEMEHREHMRERLRDPEAVRPHVERWLETVKESDPDEYQRLTELRDENPAAFRVETRQRLHDARLMRRMREDHPDLHERLTAMPREERDRMRQALRSAYMDDPMRSARHRRTMHLDMRRNETVRALIERWRIAETPEEQEEVRSELRAHLGDVFDQHTEEQEEDIRRAEEQLERLRQIHAERQGKRDDWIDRVMEHVLRRQDERYRDRERPDRGQVPEDEEGLD